MISHYYQIDNDEALKRFYESNIGANYADDETGLYGQSALHISVQYILEKDGELDEKRFV